jgi:hypothetical protein
MRRIIRDFAPLVPGLKLEVVSPEGFQARIRGKFLSADGSVPREVPEETPIQALPSSLTIVVEVESLAERVSREDRRLRRPLVEGLILREILYLMTVRQPLPDPRSRAENILRRHWPFQYAALRSLGMTVTGFGHIQEGPELAKDN